MTNKRILAIIGIGPRGGYALEKLVLELSMRKGVSRIHLLLFEETGHFGNGQVYDIDQTKTNWINISERILLLDKRVAIDLGEVQIPSFPSYHEWIDIDFNTSRKEQADTYPPRAKVGAYLQQRFQTFIKPLLKAKIVSLFNQRVVEVKLESPHKITIRTNLNTFKEIDEVLLTIGHQPTTMSKQMLKWNKYAINYKSIKLFETPYPVTGFLRDENLSYKSTIGLRGFGLAMIDVVRAIAEKYGNFVIEDPSTKSCKYQTAYDIRDLFVPFSLDGLPPAPKPLNAQIDKWFEPTAKQISDFEEIIGNKATQREAHSPYFLISAFAPIAAKIYLELPQSYLSGKLSVREIENIIEEWLQNDKYKHPTIISHEQSAKETMQDFVGMALGSEAVSLDFCIGQVWRYCQPSIFEKLSFNECSEEVFAEIIELDEGTKRYSYGPPVESIQQMLALIEAGAMNLEMVNNPEFELTDKGWCFNSEGKTITANLMINSVLDAPKIQAVNSPIVKSMLSSDLIEAVHDQLGVSTDENGYLISKDRNSKIPIALLGRLAKGTIIGVDAILECFGERPQKWAVESANRHIDWLDKNLAQNE